MTKRSTSFSNDTLIVLGGPPARVQHVYIALPSTTMATKTTTNKTAEALVNTQLKLNSRTFVNVKKFELEVVSSKLEIF